VRADSQLVSLEPVAGGAGTQGDIEENGQPAEAHCTRKSRRACLCLSVGKLAVFSAYLGVSATG
jgi:hypothetical protein